MLIEMTVQQRDALVSIINQANFQGQVAEVIVQLKQVLMRPKPDEPKAGKDS